MPFITLNSNLTLSSEQEELLKSGLGELISLIPYKSEQSLMLIFNAPSTIYLRGEKNQPYAYLKIAVFNNPKHSGYPELSFAITQLLQKVLKIPAPNIYIQYEDIGLFAVAGQCFGS